MAFGKKSAPVTPGKRFLGRLRVRLPARLVTLSRTYPAILLDVSGGGAKVEVTTEGDLPHGQAVLHWGDFEAYGTVCWQRGNQCGVAFGSKVAQAVLIATGTFNAAAALPGERDLTGDAARAWADGSGKFGFD